MTKRKRKRKQQQQMKKQKEEKEQKVNDYFQTDISKLAYGGRDTVNQAVSYAPKLIKKASNESNTITKQKIESILPKIIRGAIEDLYQTP